MALKSSYNGTENKMRMKRIAKPIVSGATTSGLMKKTATPRSTGTNIKRATSSGSAMKKTATARKKIY